MSEMKRTNKTHCKAFSWDNFHRFAEQCHGPYFGSAVIGLGCGPRCHHFASFLYPLRRIWLPMYYTRLTLMLITVVSQVPGLGKIKHGESRGGGFGNSMLHIISIGAQLFKGWIHVIQWINGYPADQC